MTFTENRLGRGGSPKTENGVSATKRDVLCQLRRIARAPSEEEFNEAVADLKASNAWVHNNKTPALVYTRMVEAAKGNLCEHCKMSCSHIYRAVTHLPYMYNVIVYKKRFVFMSFVYTSSLFIKTMQLISSPKRKCRRNNKIRVFTVTITYHVRGIYNCKYSCRSKS